MTPLHCAAHYDHVNIALLLLEEKASPHATAKNGYTPLHIAARKNQIDIATTLLEYTANPNAASKVSDPKKMINIFVNVSNTFLFRFSGWFYPGSFGRSRRTYGYGGIVGAASCQCKCQIEKWINTDASLRPKRSCQCGRYIGEEWCRCFATDQRRLYTITCGGTFWPIEYG